MIRVLFALLILSAFAPAPVQAADDEAEILAAARMANDRYQRHLKRLFATIEGEDEAARAQAFRSLGHTGDPTVVPRLIAYLDPDVHSHDRVIGAARALAALGAGSAADAIHPLTTRDGEDEKAIRLAGINALATLERMRDADFERISDEANPNLRATGVTDLGTIQAEDAGPILARALRRDSRDHIRRMAAIGLGRLGASAHAQVLIDALTDRDPLVRRYAAEALVLLDHKPAIPYLLIALEADVAGNDINRAMMALSGKDFGYHAHANIVEKREAVERGFAWWAENAKQFE